jgi:hypothetical protein
VAASPETRKAEVNTSLKEVVRKTCTDCGEVFEVVGQAVIRLAQPRPSDTRDGNVIKGKCPKHPRNVSDSPA